MRSQRQSRVRLRYEDTIHNINNSKTTKKKNDSKNRNKSNKEDVMFEEGEVESCNSGDSNEDVELNYDGSKGVFGNADKEDTEVKKNNEVFPKQNLNTYASMVKVDDIPKELDFIPTVITEDGNEVVIFDEEIIKKGSERWCLTICGQFVGYDMHINELRDEIGLNAVIKKGHWMVRNKPLFV
ncbi:hypothetical protein Tco_0439303 [Tanacetum coccineum]